jgi:transposase-like protein
LDIKDILNFQFNSVIELINKYKTEQDCIKYLEASLWNGNVVSPYDSSSKVYKCKNNYYKCNNTKKLFNVRTGTFLECSNVKLTKWFIAIYYIVNHKKGISSNQLAKDLGVTQKTAYFMEQRIRNCMAIKTKLLSNITETDETFIGGTNSNKHSNKKTKGIQGRSTKYKTPVFGMIERGGNLIAQVVPNTKANTLISLIKENVSTDAHIITDEWVAYRSLWKDYRHSFVKHRIGEYVRGIIHTNNIEGFWSCLKRTILGTYHWVSNKHLQRYINESVFRYNTKDSKESNRFHSFFKNIRYSRLKYKDLVGTVRYTSRYI